MHDLESPGRILGILRRLVAFLVDLQLGDQKRSRIESHGHGPLFLHCLGDLFPIFLGGSFLGKICVQIFLGW